MAEIITAALTGCVTLIGVLLSNRAAQAVTDEKLAELTREVREHNELARRVPVVEEKIRGMERRVEKLNEREREIDHLQAQLDKLRRMNFGSRSEKVSRRIP